MSTEPRAHPPDPTRRHALALLGSVDHGRVATSMRALPFLAGARHVVADGRLLLRMHRGHGHHLACAGSVVAYGGDNLDAGDPRGVQWSVSCVGPCESAEPTAEELELLGPYPHFADGELYDPVYLRVDPRIVTVHEQSGLTPAHPKRRFQHTP